MSVVLAVRTPGAAFLTADTQAGTPYLLTHVAKMAQLRPDLAIGWAGSDLFGAWLRSEMSSETYLEPAGGLEPVAVLARLWEGYRSYCKAEGHLTDHEGHSIGPNSALAITPGEIYVLDERGGIHMAGAQARAIGDGAELALGAWLMARPDDEAVPEVMKAAVEIACSLSPSCGLLAEPEILFAGVLETEVVLPDLRSDGSTRAAVSQNPKVGDEVVLQGVWARVRLVDETHVHLLEVDSPTTTRTTRVRLSDWPARVREASEVRRG